MRRPENPKLWFLLPIVWVCLLAAPFARVEAETGRQLAAAQTLVLDRNLSPVSEITDGDLVYLQISLNESSAQTLNVSFNLDGNLLPEASCSVQAGEAQCRTDALLSLGWRWAGDGGDMHQVLSVIAGVPMGTPAQLRLLPRPVVMVHGFSSSWDAWENYLGPDGYLAQTGLRGFAVGDGQVPGTLNTGDLAEPERRTNTIAQNAGVLGEYIAAVKELTGAQQVDLLAHSMGGLISRYYIDRVMDERDVAQLIMLGSPMAGTDCSDLPAALGLYLPATLEIRPAYVREIFNRQITHRHGVPFKALAGVPILEAFKSPCTEVPSDLAVSLQSVTAIPLEAQQIDVLHTELNTSERVFETFVKPTLLAPPEGLLLEPDGSTPEAAGERLQFNRIFSGQIDPGGSAEISIPIESGVSVASFALYDTSRSLEVSVRGASGNEIELSAENNGLVVIDDPVALLYLGYGFRDPKPGEWQVQLSASEDTPAQGARYALTAHFVGGAELEARVSALLPRIGERVNVSAGLSLNGIGVDLEMAQVDMHTPDGQARSLAMNIDGAQAQLDWAPDLPGLYGLDVRVQAHAPDGTLLERTAFLSVEAQPEETDLLPLALLGVAAVGAAGVILLLAILLVLRLRKLRKRSR